MGITKTYVRTWCRKCHKRCLTLSGTTLLTIVHLNAYNSELNEWTIEKFSIFIASNYTNNIITILLVEVSFLLFRWTYIVHQSMVFNLVTCSSSWHVLSSNSIDTFLLVSLSSLSNSCKKSIEHDAGIHIPKVMALSLPFFGLNKITMSIKLKFSIQSDWISLD